MASVVIIGGGQAGVQAAESLRSEGFAGEITLIAAEQGNPYQRPQLSKEFITKEPEPKPLVLRTRDHLENHGIKVISGTEALSIDLSARNIELATASPLDFDHLVLATGSRNRKLKAPGTSQDGIHGLRTLHEARQIRNALLKAHRITIVGAGFIGLELASSARERGCEVTVLDIGDRPMARVLSTPMSEYFAQAHKQQGVDLRLGEGVGSFAGTETITGVMTSLDHYIETDFVVSGIGAVAETALAEAAGLQVAEGVIVDECLRTSVDGVWAIGDCAKFKSEEKMIRLESVQNASDQGKHVARNIINGPTPYRDVPWFWSKQCGLKLQIAGLTTHADNYVVRGSRSENRFSIFCFNHGHLLGVESVNRAADHLAARRLLAARLPVTPDQAADEQFDLKGLARSG